MVKFEATMSCGSRYSVFVKFSLLNKVYATFMAPIDGIEPAEVIVEMTVQ